MRYPFDEIRGEYRSAFLMALVVTVTALVGLAILDFPTHNDLTPFGHISFQLAGNNAVAADMVGQWTTDGVLHFAGAAIGFDYLFMLLYGLFFMVLAGWAGSRVEGGWQTVAGIASWAVFVAVFFDMVENVMLLNTMSNPGDTYPGATLVVASIKFGLIGLSLVTSLIVFAVGGNDEEESLPTEPAV